MIKLPKTFWSYVDKTKDCWIWNGAKTTDGYGQIKSGDKIQYVHRLSYQFHKGEIPKGLQIDHLCRVRNCINPEHLQVVTLRENVLRGNSIPAINARKKQCIKGHLLIGLNLVKSVLPVRKCRICWNNYVKLYRLNV